MQDFRGKTAVVTGAASGIGRALAHRCASEGAHVVLADVDEPALATLRAEIEAAGGRALAIPTDVSDPDQVAALRDGAVQAFGAVHLLFNNAGVLLTRHSWDRTLQDWEWVLGVNLWGVIHGIRTFVPLLIAQGQPAHIVNTASVAGLTAGPMLGPYTVSKHGVVGLSETLYLELASLGSPVRVSCLCPGGVVTGIMEAERNRPAALADAAGLDSSAEKATDELLRKGISAAGMGPDAVASKVFDAIRAERFWILTHPEYGDMIRQRVENVVEGRNPSVVPYGVEPGDD